jgi:uncharacterized phage protein (TIGR02218 family)
MKNFSADLVALLASKVPIYRATLIAIGPCANGAMIYATDGGDPITYAGNVYQPGKNGLYGSWARGEITTKCGVESQSCTLTVLADNETPIYFPGTSGAALLLDGIKMGLMDAAPVSVFCAYMPQYGQVVGGTGGSLVELKFSGAIGPISKLGLTKCEIEAKDMIYLLNAQVPQMLLQASCRWTLYGVGCTLTAASFSRTNSVGTVVSSLSFNPTTNLSAITPSGNFTQGYLKWTSGANAGLTNYIAAWTPGTPDLIAFDVAPLFPLHATDTFTIYQGCSKEYVACADFSNTINFGGTPNIPVPETALS